MDDKRIDYAIRHAISVRNYQRCRSRALTRLAKLHPEEFRSLYEEEKRRDELEGKKWVYLGNSVVDRVGSTRQGQQVTPSTREEGSATRNDGGEA